MRALRLLMCAAPVTFGCTRDTADPICPDLAPGDLVVTEVRGPQADDSGVSSIELYNASGGDIDLHGIRIRFSTISGSANHTALVRRTLHVAPGSYTVLALTPDVGRPANVDYGFATDFADAAFLDSAIVDVTSCGDEIDMARYESLPRTGTYSLGEMPPTADGNDFPNAWCTDTVGTPQAANTVCP